MNELVSIITPVHNAERFLPSCLNSVAAQTHKEWEHILVDDCSNDTSWAILERAAERDDRIRIFRLDTNSGAGVARNKAIEMARGNYIAFVDSDDRWYPEKLAKQLAFMKQNKYYFTFTSYDKLDEQGDLQTRIVNAKPEVTYKNALYKNPIGCLTAMYSVGYFGKQYMPEIRKRQDYALWLKLLKKANAYGLNEVLASYRMRGNSISSNKFSLLKYEWKIYREEEKLPFLTSLFYLFSAIVLKMKSYF